MTPSQVDDAFRELMAYRARAITRHVAKAAGTYSAAKADHNQFWRCTGAVTINLTAAATLTDGWCLWVRANGGAVTIDPNGAETIDGAATLVLADGQTALIVCTGTAFFSVSGGFAGTATAQLDGLTLRGTAIASATTTDIGAATGRFVHITGTTTITGLGTRAAGVERKLVFDGALTLTHNATSLILPGAANINTAAGDVAMMVSEGAGNWRCVSYQRADGAALKPPTRQVFHVVRHLDEACRPEVGHCHVYWRRRWRRLRKYRRCSRRFRLWRCRRGICSKSEIGGGVGRYRNGNHRRRRRGRCAGQHRLTRAAAVIRHWHHSSLPRAVLAVAVLWVLKMLRLGQQAVPPRRAQAILGWTVDRAVMPLSSHRQFVSAVREAIRR